MSENGGFDGLTWSCCLGQHGHVKVKIAQLKAHLSRYVQELRDGGDPIEVCVREKTVAYLSGVDPAKQGNARQQAEIEQRLAMRGLIVRQRAPVSGRRLPQGLAGDNRRPDNSVVEMRAEKDW